ncbi:putative ribonuclease H-like domain-containing protein [Tanacetum coccineum]
MAKEAEVKKQRVCNTGNMMAKPVWTNTNRINHANQFVPRPVQLNTGRPNINSVRPRVNTVNTMTSNSFSPKRPQGNWGSAVKTSAGYNWRNSKPNSNYDSGPTFIRTDHPLKNMVDRGIFDSGCSGHMTELGHFNLFSISQICDKQHKVLFTETECLVVSSDFKMPDENQILLKVPRHHNMYSFDMKTPTLTKDYACLIAKATCDESKLWHRRLGHINFKNLNKLVKGNLVRGLPSKVFKNDHTCVACHKGKQHRASCKAKLERLITEPLHTLHMDLFGPTSVKSINHASYCLVITDDCTRFSWVFFLASKDETSGILQNFIRQIENQLNHRVKIIRSDNGTEFKNRDMLEFCGNKGIKQEYSNARTPQQNGVAERMNRTLIEAARTMLADSLLPTTFWAEAVSTACYIFNRVRVTKPQNKTPYELLFGHKPIISYIRPFGCHVTILDTLSVLGKFDGKSDEGFLVGYSLNSKAYRVYNLVTKRVEVNLHVNFLEDKPNVKGVGYRWMFDIDYLTDSMNYIPVSLENQANPHAGTSEVTNSAGTSQTPNANASEEKDEDAELIVVPSAVKNTTEKVEKTKDLQEVWVLIDLPQRIKEEGIDYDEVFAPVARMEAIRLYLAFASFMGFIVYQMDVKSTFLYGYKMKRFMSHILMAFVDPESPRRFIRWSKLCMDMHLGFLVLGLQVKQNKEGLHISRQSMYAELLQRNLILPDIMFAVCTCSRFQVTPKTSHLNAMKRIFKYLKGKPNLGLWYPRESPFDLEAFSDSDYGGSNLDKKSTTVDKGKRYKRRKSSKEFAGTGLDFEEVKSAFEKVNTGGIKVSSGIEETGVEEKEGFSTKEEETQLLKVKRTYSSWKKPGLAEAIRLDALEKALKKEEVAKQKRRLKEVQFEAQSYTEEDWDTIRANLEVNSELKESVLGKDLTVEDYAKRMNQGTWKLTQLKKLDFEEVKAEFKKLVKQLDTYVPINFEATKESLKRFDSDEANEKDDSTSGTKIPINPVPVATKSPSIANYKIISKRMVYIPDCKENGTDLCVYMLTRGKYHCLMKVCKAMLDKKLQGGKPDEDCYKLLKMMEKQAYGVDVVMMAWLWCGAATAVVAGGSGCRKVRENGRCGLGQRYLVSDIYEVQRLISDEANECSKSWTCEDWVDTSGYPATTSPDIELTTGHSSSRTTAMLPQISRIEFTEEFRDWTRRIAYESVCVREVVKIFKQIKGIPGYSLRVVLCPCLCPYGGSRESSESVVMLPETCFKQPAQNGTTVSKMAKNGHFGRPLGAKHFFSSLNLRPGFHQLMSECAGRFQDCISSSLWSLLKCTSPSSLNECQKFILMVKTDQRNKTVPFVGDFLEESCFFFSHVFRFENSFGSLRNYENVNVDPYRRPNADGYRVVARSPVWKYLAILLSDKS